MKNWISMLMTGETSHGCETVWFFVRETTNKSWTKRAPGVTFPVNVMPLPFLVRKVVLCLGLAVIIPSLAFCQAGFIPEGGEYGIIGSYPGDQMHPATGLNASGGYIVWEDNITDGDGQGISARRIGSDLSGTLSVFKVNTSDAGDQEKPKVVMLNDGGAAFVWQGGSQGEQQIYARFLSSSGTWVTNDVQVNTSTVGDHQDAAITKLSNGNVVIVWSSFDQDGSLQGVYGRQYSPSGSPLGGEFQINVTTELNQRTASVAGLSDGGFVVAWVSETHLNQLSYDVSIFIRRFDANNAALSGEIRVNTGTNVCANPNIAAGPAGGFLIAWSEKDMAFKNNSWDISARTFSQDGTGGTVQRVNTMQYGDQYVPQVAALSSRYLVVWTSLGQDSSWEGVFGQFLQPDGAPAGGEFQVNTTTVSRQMSPTVAADGNSRFLVSWTSFVGGINSFDLQAQRYAEDLESLPAPAPPFVTALSSNTLSLTWPEVGGFDVANYEIYADGAAVATVVIANNWCAMTNLAPGSTHYYRLAYVLTDARHSPLSAAATNTTYGAGASWGGIPQEWMSAYFGGDIFAWPSPNADSDGDGASNKDEFMAGTDPTDKNSILRQSLDSTPQGFFLKWNTQPGLIYQVQTSADMGPWSNVGGPRFAPGYVDSLYVGTGSSSYYRIVRLR